MSDTKPLVLIVQPALMHYRQRVYSALNQYLPVHVICSAGTVDGGDIDFSYQEVHCLQLGRFRWQKQLRQIASEKAPTAVWIAADLNYLSSILFASWCRRKGIKVILHGQGLFKRSRTPMLRKFLLRRWLSAADAYVGYTQSSTDSVRSLVNNGPRYFTIRNRLELGEEERSQQDEEHTGKGVLFVGRLREGCQIEGLIAAMTAINEKRRQPYNLHIVGDGEQTEAVSAGANSHDWITWHGEVTETAALRAIAKQCAIGVYPGRAGLSVVTYMQLGLATIVGAELARMQGPEPEYIRDGFNGWHFRNDDVQDLERVLRSALEDENLEKIRRQAATSYRDLHKKSYGQEMGDVISQVINNNP